MDGGSQRGARQEAGRTSRRAQPRQHEDSTFLARSPISSWGAECGRGLSHEAQRAFNLYRRSDRGIDRLRALVAEQVAKLKRSEWNGGAGS